MRKAPQFHSLIRPKLRQSWNKINLYNLYRLTGREPQIRGSPTFFQQKWAAKAKMRAYHGEQIPEKKWVRMFSRRLLSAVDMPPQYLAATYGSEQAAGRGFGLTTSTMTAESYSKVPKLSSQDMSKRKPSQFGDTNKLLSDQFANMTPYMQMTFAPLERRLDTAVFRALFASSVRQARQFVIHGAVKVNGQKMVHPSYQLNPGDMFQVDVDKVMYATGRGKSQKIAKIARKYLERRKKLGRKVNMRRIVQRIARTNEAEGTTGEKEATDGKKTKHNNVATADGTGLAASEGADSASPGVELSKSLQMWAWNNTAIRSIIRLVKHMLKEDRKELRAGEKRVLRMFKMNAKRFLSQREGSQVGMQELVEALQEKLNSHELLRKRFKQMGLKQDDKTQEEQGYNRQRDMDKGLEGLSKPQQLKVLRIAKTSTLSTEEMRRLGRLLQDDEENPFDETKPYATPWQPRHFMPAFAFIPRYLEVNPNICAAVYLRHPVARKGMAEVPTPFSYLTSQLAHNWYLERG